MTQHLMEPRAFDAGDGDSVTWAENGHITIRKDGQLKMHIQRYDKCSENELIMLCKRLKNAMEMEGKGYVSEQ